MLNRVLDRYLLRETLNAWLAIIVVLMLIMLSTRFARLLSDAAAGEIPQTLLFRAVGLSTLQYLVLLVPIAQLLAVMLTLGRLYRDSEIAAMLGCGVGLSRLYAPFLISGLAMALLCAWLAFSVGPWAARTGEYLVRDARRMVQYTPFEAGQFKSVAGGRAVFYTDALDPQTSQLGLVFAQIDENDGNSIVIAERGRQTLDPQTGDRTITLEQGHRYAGLPGRADWDLVTFDTLDTRVTPPEFLYKPGKRRVIPTAQLWRSDAPQDRAELHWRISAPLSVLLLTLLAVPLAHTGPRSGRYGKVVLALVIYLVYANLLGAGQDWIAKGDLPAGLGLWWVHALVGLLTLVLLGRRDGWLRRRRG